MALDFLTGFGGWRPTKMGSWDPVLTRFLMMVLHMILVIPAAIAAFESLGTYRFIKRHPELSEYPYNENAKLSYFMTCFGCMTLFPWTFISTVLLCRWHGPWVLLYGVINLGLFATICTGAAIQGHFLPATADGCRGSKPYDWQVVDGHDSIFTAIAIIKKDDTSYAEAMCRGLVSDWTTVGAVLFFQAALAYISIFFDDREYSILNPFRPFFWLCLITMTPFVILSTILTGFVFPRIRLWASFARKGIVRLRKEEPVEIPLQTRYKPHWDTFHIPDTKLIQILHIEHILLYVVEYMHSADVANLALTCRAVREAVYPRNDLQFRMPKLEKHCCSFGPPTKCLYCNTKLCPTCVRDVLYPGLPGRRHVKCVPYCEPCYYSSFAQHPRGYKRPCKCHSSDRSNEFQDCCRRCAARPVVELQAERHRRYEQECRDLKNGRSNCGKCCKELGPGVRWWKCVKCGGECRAGIHPGYVGRGRGRGDVERGEGGDEGKEVGWLVRLGWKR